MQLEQAIKQRFSCRAYLNKPVAPESIQSILDIARYSPSGVNAQPWRVAVVQGERLQQLSQSFLAAHRAGMQPNPDYIYYPQEWTEPYKARRYACAMALYQALGIQREDKQKRLEASLNNYRFFGAPVSLFFYMERHLGQGAWIDMGLFMQSVMLAATAKGLATCPQASTVDYPDMIREQLGISDQYMLICGMALGYPDLDHPVNQYRTERAGLDEFTLWFD